MSFFNNITNSGRQIANTRQVTKWREAVEVVRDCPYLSRIDRAEEYICEKTRLYPHLDVAQQLRNISSWLHDNPGKRPKSGSAGYKKFVTRWLNSQDKRHPGTRRRAGRDEY